MSRQSVAWANGDYVLPTGFHSVQSDQSRHISNGYATLPMALAGESTHQLLERDLRYAWWNNHRVVDAAIGTFIEYGTKDRESCAEMWRRRSTPGTSAAAPQAGTRLIPGPGRRQQARPLLMPNARRYHWPARHTTRGSGTP